MLFLDKVLKGVACKGEGRCLGADEMLKSLLYSIIQYSFSRIYIEYLFIKLFLAEELVDKNEYYMPVSTIQIALDEIIGGL